MNTFSWRMQFLFLGLFLSLFSLFYYLQLIFRTEIDRFLFPCPDVMTEFGPIPGCVDTMFSLFRIDYLLFSYFLSFVLISIYLRLVFHLTRKTLLLYFIESIIFFLLIVTWGSIAGLLPVIL